MLSLEFFYHFLFSKRAGALIKTIARISVVGIWLGVSSLIIVVSVMNGFNRSIRERLLQVEPHLVVRSQKVQDLSSHPKIKNLNPDQVEFSAPSAQQDVILRTSEGYIQGAVAQGVTRERLLQLLEWAQQKREQDTDGLKEKVADLKENQVILGAGLASAMGLFNEDWVVLIPPETLLMPESEVPSLTQVVVKGFLATEVERMDQHSLFYILDESLQRFQTSAGYERLLEIWLKKPEDAPSVKAQLQSEDLEIETWQERNAALFFALKLEKIVVSVLVGLSTLIAGLSIISVMVLLLTQKRRDVGNMLAIGMTKRQVKQIFVHIGVLLAMGGMLAGVITGVSVSLLVDRFSQNLLPSFYEDTSIPAELQFFQIATVLVVGFVLSSVVLRWTMNRISSYEPSEILRS